MERQADYMMNLDDFRSALSSEISTAAPASAGPRLSSVLIIIYGSPPRILMTKKSRHLKIHAGEIAFPGGKFDDTDRDLLCTALRETREELGLDIARFQVAGQLDPVMTLNSNFVITPFVSIMESLPDMTPNPEVEEVLQIPAHKFLKTLQNDPRHSDPQMYTLTFREHLVWGASARMLKQLADRLAGTR